MSKTKSTESRDLFDQFVLRVTSDEKEEIQEAIDLLYKKFNPGRDKKNPGRVRAIKRGDITMEALWIGIEAIKKLSSWNPKHPRRKGSA